MNGRRVELPYDAAHERALARATLARFGVPERILDAEIPLGEDPPGKRIWGKRVTLP